jgi:hypothetical protein
MIIKSHFGPALLIFLLASCSGLGVRNNSAPSTAELDAHNPTGLIPLLRDYTFPADLEFLPGSFSPPVAAPGVGSITREQGDPLTSLAKDEKQAVTESFRAAYIEGLLRDLPLEGTLGGDLVHSWPPVAPLSLAQNWRSREAAPNSWGAPSLVLAIRGTENDDAYIVRGGILDQYGKSGGRDRLNGVAGYGAPLGKEFLSGDGVAQWFEHGLIRVDAAGNGIFQDTALPERNADAVGEYDGDDDDGTIRRNFQRARRRGIYSNLPELSADTPVRRLDIPATGTMSAWTLYFQICNRGSVLLLLPQAPDIPFQARIVTGAFLDAFLADAPETGFTERLLRALDRYGLPLTDAYPAQEADAWQETQRFTLGRWKRRRD